MITELANVQFKGANVIAYDATIAINNPNLEPIRVLNLHANLSLGTETCLDFGALSSAESGDRVPGRSLLSVTFHGAFTARNAQHYQSLKAILQSRRFCARILGTIESRLFFFSRRLPVRSVTAQPCACSLATPHARTPHAHGPILASLWALWNTLAKAAADVSSSIVK